MRIDYETAKRFVEYRKIYKEIGYNSDEASTLALDKLWKKCRK